MAKLQNLFRILLLLVRGERDCLTLILLKMKKFFETKKALAERLEYLRLLKGALVATGKGAKVGAVVTAEKSRIREEIKYISSEKTWNFNFVSGGWNTITAKTKEVAVKRASKKYTHGRVDAKSFRVATESDTRALLSLFY